MEIVLKNLTKVINGNCVVNNVNLTLHSGNIREPQRLLPQFRQQRGGHGEGGGAQSPHTREPHPPLLRRLHHELRRSNDSGIQAQPADGAPGQC